MGKKKLTPEEEEERANHLVVSFKGGPRDGATMRVAKQLQDEMRFGFPEWCTYKLAGKRVYEFVQ